MHTENQLPRLPGSALKVPGSVVVGSYPLSSQAPTHVEVELCCDNVVKLLVFLNILKKGCFSCLVASRLHSVGGEPGFKPNEILSVEI